MSSFANAQINEILKEQVGEIGYGRKVFVKKTGKKTTQYVDGNGNKVDGRKVMKYNTLLNDEIETIKKVKPTRIITKETRNMSKIEKDYPKKNKNESVEEYEKDKAKYLSKIQRSINKKAKTDDLKSSLGEEYYKNLKYVSVADSIYNEQKKKFIEDQKKLYEKKATPKPVIKKNEIIETPKPEPKKTQGKQTADQLEKRRLKYQENREKELARKRAYREANKEKINAKQDETRKTEKSKEYQKAYREKNAKIPEPRRTQKEVRAGVKAGGLEKGVLRYMDDTNKLIKKYGTQTPRKVRTDVGKKRGDYKKKEKKKYVPYDIGEPIQKSGESSDVFETRQGLWNLVRQGKLSPANLTMRKAVLLLYGDGIISNGEEITTAEWIRRIEKGGRDIEKDGLGVGNLGKAEEDPDAVY